MSALLLALRLALRDLRRRPGTAVLLLVAMLAATTTLTLGLVVRSSANAPWEHTSALTAGPHVVSANRGDPFDPTAMADLTRAPGVVAHSGPFPRLVFQRSDAFTNGPRRVDDVEVMGRDIEPSIVDRPLLTDGAWISPGRMVLEASFAATVRAKVDDRITIAGRPFTVAGIAVTAASEPMPFSSHGGLIWATRTDTASLSDLATGRASVLMLRLAEPTAAADFVATYHRSQEPRSGSGPAGRRDGGREVIGWEQIRSAAHTDVQIAMFGLILGTVCLALLAFASVAVAVTGRMATQTRRAGLLKAVGATPGLVAAVLLAQYLAIAALAAGLGLLLGAAVAPRLASPVVGVLGVAGPAAITPITVAIVTGAALGLMTLATLIPAIRAARTSTVRALQRPGRPPRRMPKLVALSGRLPTPMLLGIRLLARRPGRALLVATGLAVTVAAIVVALWLEAGITFDRSQGGQPATYEKLRLVTHSFIAGLIVLAVINAVLVAWAIAADNARTNGLARALGATPRQVATAIALATVLPALGAVLLGVPAAWFTITIAINGAENSSSAGVTPSATGLVLLTVGTVLVAAALAAWPARVAANRPVAAALRAG